MNKKKGTTFVGRDGSTTFMPDFEDGEVKDLMRKAGLGQLVDGEGGPEKRLNPLDMMAGFMEFEKLAGIEYSATPPDDLFDLPDDVPGTADPDDGMEP